MSKYVFTAIEYAACQDCLHYIVNGEEAPYSEVSAADIEAAMKAELGNEDGSFHAGVAATEEDPHGYGYNEFSSRPCELCGCRLAGERHGITMLLRHAQPQELSA